MADNGGIIAGCVILGLLAFIFLFACIYSIIKAFRDRRRIIEKNRNIRQQRLLSAESELSGGAVPPPPPPVIPEILEPEPSGNGEEGATPRRIRLGSAPNIRVGRRGSAFAPPPEPEERRWEKEGLEYRAQGKTAHIHRTQSSEFKSKKGDGAINKRDNKLKINEPGFRQRSASADIPRPILPSGETDYRVGLLPSHINKDETNNEDEWNGATPKPTIASTSTDNSSSATAVIKVTVTTHEVKESKGWV